MKLTSIRRWANVGCAGALAASTLLFAAPAQAGYEFATTVSDCKTKVDRPGDNSDLRLPVGTVDVQFFGFGLDTANSVSVSNVSGTGTTTASIVDRHSGPGNISRGCGAIGSIVVRLTSGPTSVASGFRKRLNIGTNADSQVPLSIRRYPRRDVLTWSPTQSLTCLGTPQLIDNNRILIIQLPAGHLTNSSNCTTFLNLTGTSTEDFQVDVPLPYADRLTGLPTFATPRGNTLQTGYVPAHNVIVDLTSAAIRALTTTSITNISMVAPNDLASNNAIKLEIRPNTAKILQSLQTPASIPVGDPFDLTVQMSPRAASGGQEVDFTVDLPNCFRLSDYPQSSRAANPNIRTARIAQGESVGRFSIRSLVDASCSATGTGLRHVAKMWLPGSDPNTCPRETCRTSNIAVTSRP